MQITGKCDYACRAMLELALRYELNTPVSAQLIAEQREIPEKYLTHILLQLKRAKLITSLRGAQGGYMLLRAPDAITLAEIIEAVEGSLSSQYGSKDSDLHIFWQEIAQKTRDVLARYTLASMLDFTLKSNMFHI
ncbi:MAG TPA: Rrf2 family transcriptional regulator [Candidatus Hydrogenedentes bacterium]|jgi:Rrf2 family protein|nr:MAG: HTH-type transcriptional regulator CymR [Candidatus Hydrogenedentes bacterium ADurb.Bin170]HNZ48474.1 Rrf2 family transcriptional regulator [Candidatus Hydrogenedentota bacterium]HOD94997.1 Rrf2 family transcriptional regulator [Candidatus Hydrogenedentota bacterium]HOH42358.1 Rrf2 family transcriptional regulator [Candidatus Hydrogenedentota bacterium]HOM47630.1 Rrf2 family transcriptional regulator [Candidatus Hydrogenedentota bacterium]